MDRRSSAFRLWCHILQKRQQKKASVKEQSSVAAEISQSYGGSDFEWAVKEEERSKLWQARHNAYYAALALRPGARGWPTDACVPISRLADCIIETADDIQESGDPKVVWAVEKRRERGIVAPIFGHVGDGNFHVILNVHEDDSDEYKNKIADVNDRLIKRAISMGGTCTGEHGIGAGKISYLAQEHGDEAMKCMAALKMALDPDNILNPGKIIDERFFAK
mmetsp:Transcript_7449/g.18142  ORF Transcript_7449/g.18142 Transcript_7449/m.18142 type:complete len:221 (-) Transcript_7449:106-768(-)